MGTSKNCAICLPQQVSPAMLSLILDYCRFHQVLGRSNKERKAYDEKFVRIDTEKLCELTSAADSLQLKPLVDLTSRALARIIEGRSPEEIRDIFHLPDDLTEEEKLEPLRNITDDPRIRLLNRLYAKKRKELKERERIKVLKYLQPHPFLLIFAGLVVIPNNTGADAFLHHLCASVFAGNYSQCGFLPYPPLVFSAGAQWNVEVEEEHVDERSVDDLLSFINGNDRDPKGIKTSKNKKKNRRKKDQQKNSSSKEEVSVPDKKEVVNGHNIRHQSSEAEGPCETSNLHHTYDDPMLEFDDDDTDDEIDPALKAKIDREVEDFARRLNCDWPERIKDFFSSAQERKTMLSTTNGNGFLRRHACKLLPRVSVFYLTHHVLYS
ncbi:SKP1-like protein 21-like [Trifolium pratense]|uniref:SKP1-like protein 21-like n=1 Tax=Trifolium pratense TaxID=57577 RepID=A0A2K3NYT0_TRIPR|nr:SKP1-like protein 21-like [Trifolium pratense]